MIAADIYRLDIYISDSSFLYQSESHRCQNPREEYNPCHFQVSIERVYGCGEQMGEVIVLHEIMVVHIAR